MTTEPSTTTQTRELEGATSTPRPWWLHTTGSHIGIKANGRFVIRKVVSQLSLAEYKQLHADFVLIINAVNSAPSDTEQRLREALERAERDFTILVEVRGDLAEEPRARETLRILRAALQPKAEQEQR